MDKSQFSLDFEKPLQILCEQLSSLTKQAEESQVDLSKEIQDIQKKISTTQKKIYSELSTWQRVQLARHPQRPYSLDFIERIFLEFQELHGDRHFGDDGAIIGGTAFLGEIPVMVIGQQKGRTLKENIKRNFGCPLPEGYRKALRLIRLAEKLSLPVITLVDTSGAYPGVDGEERHVAEAIAVNLREMSQLKTPIFTVILGEGGSGGALGIAVADKILMFENAYYSVISPEGCAAILWNDRNYTAQAAETLKMSATALKELKIIDEVLLEPPEGAHNNHEAIANTLKEALLHHLPSTLALPLEDLVQKRFERFRNYGLYLENALS